MDFPLVDDDTLYKSIKEITPDGIDKVLELVGFTAIFSDMQLLKKGGLTCFTGALDGVWTFDDFSPFLIPSGTFLTSYAGEATDLPATVLEEVLINIEKGTLQVPIAKVYYGLSAVGKAHENLESGQFSGKHVVVI